MSRGRRDQTRLDCSAIDLLALTSQRHCAILRSFQPLVYLRNVSGRILSNDFADPILIDNISGDGKIRATPMEQSYLM